MKIAWVTYLGALSLLNAILIPRVSAHPPILAQCKVHRPWALFHEATVYLYAYSISYSISHSILHFSILLHAHLDIHYTGNVHRNENMKQACLMLYHNKNLLVRINNGIM